MKLLLLFLILVNAIFFAWARWVDVSPEGVSVATPEPEAEALVLYDEKYPAEVSAAAAVAVPEPVALEPEPEPETDSALEPETPPEMESEPASVDVAEPAQALDSVQQVAEAAVPAQPVTLLGNDGPATRRCLTIGPFRELSVAGTLAAALRSSGLAPRAREQDAQVWVGHWVHLAPAQSRAAAVEVVEKLRNDGVSDIYIEPGGPMRHAISLGLFSDKSRAEIRAGKVRKLGVRPQIRDRYRERTQHWVDIDLEPGQQLNEESFAQLPEEDAALAERPCEDYTTPPTPE